MRRRLRNSAGVEAGSWRNTPFLFSDPAKVFVRRTRGPAWRSLRCVPVSAPLQPVIGDEETLKRGMLEKRWFATLPFIWSRPVAAAGKGGAGPGGGIGGVGCAGGRAASCGAGAASGSLFLPPQEQLIPLRCLKYSSLFKTSLGLCLYIAKEHRWFDVRIARCCCVHSFRCSAW